MRVIARSSSNRKLASAFTRFLLSTLPFSGAWLGKLAVLTALRKSTLGAILPLIVLVTLAVLSWSRFGPAVHYTAHDFIPHLSLDNAVFWSTVFFAFGGVEAGSAMGDEISNPRRTIPLAIFTGGVILTVGYIAGTLSLLVALPSNAVAGPDGFVHGIHLLSSKLHLEWIVAPVALLVAANAVGGAAAYLSSTSRLPFVAGVDRYLPAAFGKIHPRYQTPWVAIGIYGIAGIIMALLGQAGSSVRGTKVPSGRKYATCERRWRAFTRSFSAIRTFS